MVFVTEGNDGICLTWKERVAERTQTEHSGLSQAEHTCRRKKETFECSFVLSSNPGGKYNVYAKTMGRYHWNLYWNAVVGVPGRWKE